MVIRVRLPHHDELVIDIRQGRPVYYELSTKIDFQALSFCATRADMCKVVSSRVFKYSPCDSGRHNRVRMVSSCVKLRPLPLDS